MRISDWSSDVALPIWPSDPYSFKYTNLLLHLLNGVLVFACLRSLLHRCSFTAFKAELIAVLTAAIWLLHPIHTATVLQVVQRMTLLSSLFILLGEIGRASCRERVCQYV